MYLCTRVDTWEPTAVPVMVVPMSCLVSCGLGWLDWSRRRSQDAQAATAGGQASWHRILCIIVGGSRESGGWT